MEPPGEAAPSLAGTAVRGVAVTTASQLGRMLTQVVSVIILARLLTPTDYGLVAMVLSVIGVGELVRDLGLSPAAIRAECLDRALRDNLFWVNTGLGVLLALVVAAASPLIASAFGRDELVPITLALAPTFVLSGLMTQYRVDLTRRYAFGRLAAIDLSCSVLPLMIGIVAASLGAAYWALVLQQVVSGVLGVALLAWSCRWTPGRYDRSASVMPFVRLGSSFLLGGLLGYVMRNADAVVVGRAFGADALGIYNRSVQLVRTPLTQVQAPFGSVTLPVLAAARDDDERLLRAAARAQVAFTYPVLVGVAWIVAASEEVVRITLGSAWTDAAPVMRFVAIAGGAGCLAYVVLWIFAARALASRMNLFNVTSAVLVVAGILVGSRFGVEGVAAGIAAATVAGWPLALTVLGWRGYLRVAPLAWAGVRAAAVAALGALAADLVLATVPFDAALPRAGAALLTVLAVAALAALVTPVRRDYAEVTGMLRLLRGRGVKATADLTVERPSD
ncbi:lipopolysaccharide biosynthesis protein [Nocardioides bigeumensis]|uniref:Lipopolysaccharide biosynthesis protein n=1 Tax=Nocardioides bigeumensis TaxID=433657 RepID=A0ABP5K966_9ACTN